MEARWGEVINPLNVEEVLKNNENIKLVAVVHAETSTGVKQPLNKISELTHQYGALFVCDMVTSLGGCPTLVDELQVDAAYSGTQKCLSAPPGLAPVSFSPRALQVISERKQKVQSWYLDLSMIQNYWGKERFYHHTAPITMVYALRESLRLIIKEGLENVYERHSCCGQALQAGIEAMGLSLLVSDKEHRLPQLTSVLIPEGVEDAKVRSELLEKYGLEIGGGLGDLKGQIWRIGLMGYNATLDNVIFALAALENVLLQQGATIQRGKALQAATNAFH